MAANRPEWEVERDRTIRSVWAFLFWTGLSAVLGAFALNVIYETVQAALIGAVVLGLVGASLGSFAVTGKGMLSRGLKIIALVTYPPFWFGI